MDGIGVIGIILALAAVGIVFAALGPFAIGLPYLFMVGVYPIYQGYKKEMES